MNDDTFFLKEETDKYVVNCEMATCDCPYEAGGRFCKHLCTVEKKHGAVITTSLRLNDSDRQQNSLWVTNFHRHSLKILRVNQAQILKTDRLILLYQILFNFQ